MTGNKYSDEDLLDEIRRLADELGKTPSTTDMNKIGAWNASIYNRRFGSWNDAVVAAGLEPNPVGAPSITEEELIEELQALADGLGKTPTCADMNDYGLYSDSVYQKQFDSWNAAIEAAGLEPNHASPSSSDEDSGRT